MQVYLVGGAVRDELLGVPVAERDWVVVGATREEMLARGFREVGRDFPVFLHPDSQEEYALARLERKTAPGYRGFVFDASASVTLEDDLLRRDLTINAIAKRTDGTLVDPYGGAHDLEARILRHVSPAFAEDPVRLLRVARFAARFAHLGFRVADATLELMRSLVAKGEVNALIADRVWQETEKALRTAQPSVFFETLRSCGALAVIFPELEALHGVPQPERWHPEIDSGLHTMMVIEQAARLTDDPVVRFAAAVHDIGKGTTPRSEWPSHPGHEQRGAEMIARMAERLHVPNEHRDLAVIVAREHALVHRSLELRPATIVELLERTDAVRRPARFEQFLLACEADARGRRGLEERAYPQREWLRSLRNTVAEAKPSPQEISRAKDGDIAGLVHKLRIDAVTRHRAAHKL
jgi:tRNA nucleotidyltransferase (CCA-adding enzyme)